MNKFTWLARQASGREVRWVSQAGHLLPKLILRSFQSTLPRAPSAPLTSQVWLKKFAWPACRVSGRGDCISWSCCFDIIPGWRLHTWPPISLVLPLVLPDVADTSKRHAHTACMLALTCCCLSFCALG
eukprot:1158775-Pelagomonas_calceolata.AAC.1